jgi:hypothetical protein
MSSIQEASLSSWLDSYHNIDNNYVSDTQEYLSWWKWNSYRFADLRSKYYKRYKNPWRLSTSGISSFRQEGYSKKNRKDSLNRDEKTRDYRKNRKYAYGGSAKTWAKYKQRRWDRVNSRHLIRNNRWDELYSTQAPRDAWMWS